MRPVVPAREVRAGETVPAYWDVTGGPVPAEGDVMGWRDLLPPALFVAGEMSWSPSVRQARCFLHGPDTTDSTPGDWR